MKHYIDTQAEIKSYRYHLNTKEIAMCEDQKKFNIYLIDDDEDDLLFSEKALKISDRVINIYRFKGPNAVFSEMDNHGLFKSENFSLNGYPIILMDIHMPCVNGIEMLESLKSHPMTDEIPVVLISSDVSGTKIHDAYRLQAYSYLKKPLDIRKFNIILDDLSSNEQSSSVKGNYLM